MAAENSNETSVGMPQLDFGTFPNQLFWILVFTLLFYLAVRYIIIPRLEGIMSSRQDLINADIQQAEEFNREAQEIEGKIKKKMEEAHKEAANILVSTKSQVKEKIDLAMQEIDETIFKQTKESEKKIKRIEQKSEDDIRKIALELTKQLVGRFSKNKPSSAEVEKILTKEIKENTYE